MSEEQNQRLASKISEAIMPEIQQLIEKARAEGRDEVMPRLNRLIEALTPSAETKAAYIGEFSFSIPDSDEDGEEAMRSITVPWTTVKQIMAAIRKRAAILADESKEDGKERPSKLLECSVCGNLDGPPCEPGDTCSICGIGVYRRVKARL